MQSWFSPDTYVASSGIAGVGLFARVDLPARSLVGMRGGSLVGAEQAREYDARFGMLALEIEKQLFLSPTSEEEATAISLRINHSCTPNVGIRGQISFVTMRGVRADEELTCDYATTDSFPVDWLCQCATPRCRRTVTGDDWRRPELQGRYKGFFSTLIQERINQLPL